MTDIKKQWVKPELIVLVRSNPAEAVLGACKDSGWDPQAPANRYGYCTEGEWAQNASNCVACMAIAAS
jgi:hypothetical protein